MAEINSVVIVGRLTRDPELKYTHGGMAILKGSIAQNRRKKSGDQWVDEANFFDFDYIGKGAEAAAKYLTKGIQVAIQGELRQERWTDKNTQEQKSRVGIHVLSLKLLDGKKEGQSESGQSGSYQEDDSDIPF